MPSDLLSLPTKFEEAVAMWREAAKEAATLKAVAEMAFATALIRSEGKTEAIRKAEAELAAAPQQLSAAVATIDERVVYHMMIHLRHGGIPYEEAA